MTPAPSPRGKRALSRLIAVALVAFVGLSGCSDTKTTPSATFPLQRTRDVPLPGSTKRFDYQSIDAAGRRLFIAHLGDSTVDIVDVTTLTTLRTVAGIEQVHGIANASDLGRVYATATGTNELVAFDPATGRILTRTRTGQFPDGVTYDADDRLVLVSDKNDGSLTEVDARNGRAVRTLHLGDETGNVTYDARTHLVYVAVRFPEQLVAIDPVRSVVTERIRLTGCDGAHGVYIAPSHRAFVACERNARLATIDTDANRQIAIAHIGDDPDVLAYDPGLQRLYVASESGTVSVFDTSAGTPQKIGEAHLADSAHTVAVDPLTHDVFFPLQDIHGQPVLRVMHSTTTAR